MLVLSRKPGQQIRIGLGICLTVLELRGKNSVRIGIDAPADVPVYREELCGAATWTHVTGDGITSPEPYDAARRA